MVTCEVKLPNFEQHLVISIIYAANCEGDRRELWNEIVQLSRSPILVGKPWSLLGDFNETVQPSDQCSTRYYVVRGIRDFRMCLMDSSLGDLTYRGSTFTWWNQSVATPVAKKLDRILVNDNWSLAFPHSVAYFGDPDFSDHSPGSIALSPSVEQTKKPFRFLSMLLLNPGFLPLITHVWPQLVFEGTSMFRLSKKLKALKNTIRAFSRDNFSGIERRTAEAHSVMTAAQQVLLANPSHAAASAAKVAHTKWSLLSRAEEAFFCQRSRITWLREGDGNTYFHRIANARQATNRIHCLETVSGIRLESQQDILNHCIDYFSNLLGMYGCSPP